MSGPTFTSPPAEVAEMNRIQYDLEYTEGISQRMRIPETLMVAADKPSGPLLLQQPLPVHTTMQVPERIVVAGGFWTELISKLCMKIPRDLLILAIFIFLSLISLSLQVMMGTLYSLVPETWT